MSPSPTFHPKEPTASSTAFLRRLLGWSACLRSRQAVLIAIALVNLLCLHDADRVRAADTVPATRSLSAQLPDFSDVACLENALRLAGQRANSMTLLTHPRWPASGEPTLEDLEVMAKDQGASTARFTQLSVQQLARLAGPVILHLKGSRYSAQADHYVLCTSVQGDQAQLFNPPGRTCLVPLDLLATRWDGQALAVSASAIQLPSAPWLEQPATRHGLLWLLAGLLVLGGWAYRRQTGNTPVRNWRRTAMAGAGQGMLLVTGAGILGLGLRVALGMSTLPIAAPSLLPEGPDPMDFLVKVDVAGKVAEQAKDIDLTATQQAIQQGALVLDARDANEYAAGHIKGALSCPASDVAHLRLYLAGIPKDRQIVVYCASAACGKAHYLASSLLQNSYSDVAVYPPGWSNWPGAKESGGH